jgi:hypothetical protein
MMNIRNGLRRVFIGIPAQPGRAIQTPIDFDNLSPSAHEAILSALDCGDLDSSHTLVARTDYAICQLERERGLFGHE